MEGFGLPLGCVFRRWFLDFFGELRDWLSKKLIENVHLDHLDASAEAPRSSVSRYNSGARHRDSVPYRGATLRLAFYKRGLDTVVGTHPPP